MKKSFFKSIPLCALIALQTLLSLNSIAADTLQLSEDFIRTAAKSSTPLNGFTTKEGHLAWEASKNLFVVSNDKGACVSAKDNGTFQARLRLPEKSRIVIVEADMKSVSGSEQQSWAAIGLGAPTQLSTLWPKGIILLLNTQGEYECHYVQPDGKTLELIKRGKVTDYNPDQQTTLHLEFNRELQTLSISINNRSALSDYELANKNLTVEPSFAGISGYSQKTMEPTLTRFQLSSQP